MRDGQGGHLLAEEFAEPDVSSLLSASSGQIRLAARQDILILPVGVLLSDILNVHDTEHKELSDKAVRSLLTYR